MPCRLVFRHQTLGNGAIDCRYHGQEHTVRVPIVTLGEPNMSLATRFHHLHKQQFTFELEQTGIELVNYRLTTTVDISQVHVQTRTKTDSKTPEPAGVRTVAFADGDITSTPIYHRECLASGFHTLGPAIIEEPSSTTVVLAGQRFRIDAYGNILIAGDQPIGKEPTPAG